MTTTPSDEMLERMAKDVEARLAELRPTVAEARRLEEVLAALRADRSGGADEAAAPTGEERITSSNGRGRRVIRSPRTRSAATRVRISGEERRRQVLDLIRAEPDITAREIAERTDTSPNNIYNFIRRLEDEGRLTQADGRFTVQD